MKKICVIIPCYNEAQRLELEVFREFVGREERFDFCFVNDGSQDNTSEVLRRAVELEPGRFLLVDNADNRGTWMPIWPRHWRICICWQR